jgi:hypothetical protein
MKALQLSSFSICFVILLASWVSPIYASCNIRTIGDKTLTSSVCAIDANTLEGVDRATNELASINTAALTLANSAITINTNAGLVAGTIQLQGTSTVSVLQTNAFLGTSGLWVADADGDGWPATTTMLYQSTASGRRRLGLMKSMVTADCSDSTYSPTNTCFTCGNTLTVNHVAGPVSPITTTISYGTVQSSITGSSKCWITRNLGASQQASSATDPSEASGGWYWAFNRMQGFKNDGTTLTPSTWNSSTDTASATWEASKDPCTLLLGSGWRIPTAAEWIYADGASGGNWSNHTNTFASVLKIHSAGQLNQFTGVLSYRGTYGGYWSSTAAGAAQSTARILQTSATTSVANSDQLKSVGYSVRCIKD